MRSATESFRRARYCSGSLPGDADLKGALYDGNAPDFLRRHARISRTVPESTAAAVPARSRLFSRSGAADSTTIDRHSSSMPAPDDTAASITGATRATMEARSAAALDRVRG